MKKLIITLALLAACRTTTTVVEGPPTVAPVASGHGGASDPTSAVRGFMHAAKQADLNALGALWGDKDGAARDKMPRDELEKRQLYIMRCLRHDKYEIVGDAQALGGARAMVLVVNFGDVSRSADFSVVRGPENRWFVQDINVIKLQDICMKRA